MRNSLLLRPITNHQRFFYISVIRVTHESQREKRILVRGAKSPNRCLVTRQPALTDYHQKTISVWANKKKSTPRKKYWRGKVITWTSRVGAQKRRDHTITASLSAFSFWCRNAMVLLNQGSFII